MRGRKPRLNDATIIRWMAGAPRQEIRDAAENPHLLPRCLEDWICEADDEEMDPDSVAGFEHGIDFSDKEEAAGNRWIRLTPEQQQKLKQGILDQFSINEEVLQDCLEWMEASAVRPFDEVMNDPNTPI